MPLTGGEPAARSQALDLFVKLMRARNAVFAAVEPGILAAGLTATQFGVLEALLHKGQLSHRALCAAVLTSPGNLTDVIDKLEARGLIARQREAADARRICVCLTSAGTALIAAAFPPHAAQITAVMSRLDQTEQQILAMLLRKLGLAATSKVPK